MDSNLMPLATAVNAKETAQTFVTDTIHQLAAQQEQSPPILTLNSSSSSPVQTTVPFTNNNIVVVKGQQHQALPTSGVTIPSSTSQPMTTKISLNLGALRESSNKDSSLNSSSRQVSDPDNDPEEEHIRKLTKENEGLRIDLEHARKKVVRLEREREALILVLHELHDELVSEGKTLLLENDTLSDLDDEDKLLLEVLGSSGKRRGTHQKASSTNKRARGNHQHKRSRPHPPLLQADTSDAYEDYQEDEFALPDTQTPSQLISPSTPASATAFSASISEKKKKKIMRPIAETVFKTVPVPMDSQGNPVLPFSIGLHTIHTLGTIVWDRPNYHNKRYIFPVGYHSSRSYLSCVNPGSMTTWNSRIKDGGAQPLFEVTAEDDPEHPYCSSTSTGAWSAIMRQAAAIRNKEPAGSASGPDFYGLGHATINQLIDSLPGAEKCSSYEVKRYELSKSKMPAQALSDKASNGGSSTSSKIVVKMVGDGMHSSAHPSSSQVIASEEEEEEIPFDDE